MNQPNPIPDHEQLEALAERRVRIEEELIKLLTARADAILSGSAVDHAAIANLEADLAAITDAEAAVIHRQRAVEAENELARLRGIRAKIDALEQDRLEALDRAEAAARAFAAAAIAHRKVVEDIRKGVVAYAGHVPWKVTPRDMEEAMSQLLADALRPVGVSPAAFGRIRLPGVDFSPNTGQPWRDAKSLSVMPVLSAYLKDPAHG
jgi:hypothetical protein